MGIFVRIRFLWQKKRTRFVQNNKGSGRWKRSGKNRRGLSSPIRADIVSQRDLDMTVSWWRGSLTRISKASIVLSAIDVLQCFLRQLVGQYSPRARPFILNGSVKGGSLCDHPNFILFFSIAATADQIERAQFSDWCIPFSVVVIANV